MDVFLIKTNASGDTLWTKTFGNTGEDIAQSVRQTSDGGYIITGNTNSFNLNANDFDVYLIKTDADGISIWEKIYSDSTAIDNSTSVLQTSDGGYIITGQTYSSTGEGDVLLIKANANGDTLWTKSYSRLSFAPDAGYSVSQTTDGGYIIAGRTLTGGSAGYDAFLIKTDANGDTAWTKTYGGAGLHQFNAVQTTVDGGFIITGQLSNGASGMDVLIVRTDSSGDSLWTKVYGTASLDWGNSVRQTTDGGFFIGGQSMLPGMGWNFYLIKTDSSGNAGCMQSAPAITINTPPFQLISPSLEVSSPATFSTNPAVSIGNGGFFSTYCTTVGIKEPTADNFLIVSPNPSSGSFIISFEDRIINGNVEILNLIGESVYTEKISNDSNNEIQLQISGGIYFLKVFDGANSYCKKIIIE